MDDICSEIRSEGLDLKRDGVKAVQLKMKATTEEPKKINEAKNSRFEVVIFGRWSAQRSCLCPTCSDQH